jgi:hypothetical protein
LTIDFFIFQRVCADKVRKECRNMYVFYEKPAKLSSGHRSREYSVRV